MLGLSGIAFFGCPPLPVAAPPMARYEHHPLAE